MLKIDNNVLKTSADDLHELVKSRKKISVEEAAKLLKIPINIVQSLVDFLVEERIFGIEYKFTTPYIYISEKSGKKIHAPLTPPPPNEEKLITKNEFFQKANQWKLPPQKLNELWKKYLNENMDLIKKAFYEKAHDRKLSEERISRLWEKYTAHIQ